jgi:hypothetical protein
MVRTVPDVMVPGLRALFCGCNARQDERFLTLRSATRKFRPLDSPAESGSNAKNTVWDWPARILHGARAGSLTLAPGFAFFADETIRSMTAHV